MTSQASHTGTLGARSDRLSRIGGVSALMAGILLLIGMISLIQSIVQQGSASGWLLLFQNNWLVKILILHAGFAGIHVDLYGLNLLDIVILLLVGMICLGLSRGFRNASRVWSLIALVLSGIAILLFLATQLAGRSTVMLAVLINSCIMLRDKTFSRFTVYAGILASVLLFAGDLTVGVHSDLITVLFGLGYVLLIAWFFLIARTLLRPGRLS